METLKWLSNIQQENCVCVCRRQIRFLSFGNLKTKQEKNEEELAFKDILLGGEK